jgi:hypothetical protein
MNKKNFTVVSAVLMYVLAGLMSADLMAQTKNKSEAAAEKAALAEGKKLAAKRAALTEKSTQMLKSREWAIYVTIKPATEKSPAVIEADTLIFTDRTVLSKNLAAQGYSKNGSNYSLSVSDSGIASWETMQLNDNGQDIAFLRGDLNINSEIMQGAIIYKPSKGNEMAQAYSTIKPQETALEPAGVSTAEKTEETAKSEKKGKK